jgi:(1->4)-alpha-D-glucan 1-alpha-D-glucosylmutase
VEGQIKLYVTWRLLTYRLDHAALCAEGDYQAVEVLGLKKQHVVAFRRAFAEEALVAVVPRLVVGLTGGREITPLGEELWQDTWLILPEEDREHRYRNLFTGESLSVEEGAGSPGLRLSAILSCFPVAVLIRE